MDSSDLTRLKKNRSIANSINGTSPRPLLPINEGTHLSYKLGSKLVTYNKRVILPGCTGPTCNNDNTSSVQTEYNITTILERPETLIYFVVLDNSNNLFWVETNITVFPTQFNIYRRDAVTNVITQIHTFVNPSGGDGLSDIVTDSLGNLYFYEYIPLSSPSMFILTKITFNLDGSVNSTTTVSGTEIIGNNATLGLTLDETNGDIYVTINGPTIYKTNINGSSLMSVAGAGTGYEDGLGTSALFSNFLAGITLDIVNNYVYVADINNNCIRKIDVSSFPSPSVTTYSSTAGSSPPTTGPSAGNSFDVNISSATFTTPFNIQIDSNGVLYVADTGNNQIKKIDPSGFVTLFAGSGVAGNTNASPLTSATLNSPISIFIKSPSEFYIAEIGDIRKITTV